MAGLNLLTSINQGCLNDIIVLVINFFMLFRYLLCAFLFVHTLQAQTYTLKGKIVGHDGKPLVMAHILLSYNRDTIAWVAADANGFFTISYAENKTYDCKVTGVHHRPYFGKVYPAETP